MHSVLLPRGNAYPLLRLLFFSYKRLLYSLLLIGIHIIFWNSRYLSIRCCLWRRNNRASVRLHEFKILVITGLSSPPVHHYHHHHNHHHHYYHNHHDHHHHYNHHYHHHYHHPHHNHYHQNHYHHHYHHHNHHHHHHHSNHHTHQ